MTYSDPQVRDYIAANLVPLHLSMGQRESWQLFRANHIIWTPSIAVADHNGSAHYQSPGFLPPSDFLSALKIGRARCLVAWTRSAEGIRELESAAEVENSMTPEVLFWLAAAAFLERRDTTRMYALWQDLTTRYPESPWSHRTYPRPEE